MRTNEHSVPNRSQISRVAQALIECSCNSLKTLNSAKKSDRFSSRSKRNMRRTKNHPRACTHSEMINEVIDRICTCTKRIMKHHNSLRWLRWTNKTNDYWFKFSLNDLHLFFPQRPPLKCASKSMIFVPNAEMQVISFVNGSKTNSKHPSNINIHL